MHTKEVIITKLQQILADRGLTQTDLFSLCREKIGKDRISRIVTGKLLSYQIPTGLIIADALGVSIDDIIEKEHIRQSLNKEE